MMREQQNAWGETPLVVRNHSTDSLRWRRFQLRTGDVIIDSWAKAGTTWLQQLIAHLLYGIGGRHQLPKVTPWLDSPYVSEARLIAINGMDTSIRRIFKSHLDARALPYHASARYICAARDGRDSVWSWYQHHRALRPAVYAAMEAVVGAAGMLRPPDPDFRAYFIEWLERDGHPLWPFWAHLKSWWELRHRPNVLLLHYDEILRDPRAQIGRVAGFLGVDVSSEEMSVLLEVTSKEYMARNVSWISPDLFLSIGKGGQDFFRGARRGWREFLTEDDMSRYVQVASAELGDECARWLAYRMN